MPPKRACDVCYKRKIQCSIINPEEPCEWCSHHDVACTFAREPRKKKKTSRDLSQDVQELSRRIEVLEQNLSHKLSESSRSTEAISSPVGLTTPATERECSVRSSTLPNHISWLPHSQASPSSYLSSHGGRRPFEAPPRLPSDLRRYLGQNWYHRGIPILSDKGYQWVESRTGKAVDLAKFNLFGSKSTRPSAVWSYEELCELPDRHVAEGIVSSLLLTPSRPFYYPVLDPVLFDETVSSAYEASTASMAPDARVSAKACVLAALAVATRLKGSDESLNSAAYGDRAQCLILGHISGEVSLDSAQAVILLHLYRTVTGEWDNAVILFSMASRLICGLGGHIYQPEMPGDSISYDERRTQHIRKLFWMCHMVDKGISLRCGQPPMLSGDFCDLTPPSWYTGVWAYAPELDGEQETGGPLASDSNNHLPGIIGLSHIKEKALKLLYSPNAAKLSDSQILVHIRQLDDELEHWRLSIPQDFRPKLSIAPDCVLFSPRMSVEQRMCCRNLQLEYHYLVTTIHTAVRRCGATYAEGTEIPDDLHGVFHSSLDLALEASRSTLSMLRNPDSGLEEEPFWRIAFYPSVAAMSLFVNILVHPLSAQAQKDLEILASAVSISQNISTASMTGDDMEYLQEMNNFVMELVQLANCAMWKARREGRRDPCKGWKPAPSS
ncbi:hypothetical protein jhhlp_000767 [Lomentospora prolificans]|uniref:Zn(2)-C6 fungal-type domain-containing protein n=1 Tax=Lomentospora prolificans TaxID=41688 RepID=A0A2N3NJD0_9PEZI|nr:hypothetical protein jhhlp_000767 [Lomentospora prolificans]